MIIIFTYETETSSEQISARDCHAEGKLLMAQAVFVPKDMLPSISQKRNIHINIHADQNKPLRYFNF